MPRRGAWRFRSISTVRAFSGETYSTRQRSASAGTGCTASRSMHQKNAASVLPLPVGADIRVCCPAATDLQPPSWTSVGAGKAPANQARAAGENRSRTGGIGLSLLPRVGGSKPEVPQQLLGAQVAPGGENRPALLQQSGVVWRWAANLFAERDDLAVEVLELAARTTLNALEGRGTIGAVGWKIAGEPLAGHAVAEPQGKRRHQPKGPGSAALVETEPTKLRRSDPFANRRDRQPLEPWMAQRLADRQPGDG